VETKNTRHKEASLLAKSGDYTHSEFGHPEPFDVSRDRARVTGKPEVFCSPVGLVPTNALVLTGLANFQVVAYSQLMGQVPINAASSTGRSNTI
jgi:hypothetical protein